MSMLLLMPPPNGATIGLDLAPPLCSSRGDGRSRMLETCSTSRRMRLYRPKPTGHARMPPGPLNRRPSSLKGVSTPRLPAFTRGDHIMRTAATDSNRYLAHWVSYAAIPYKVTHLPFTASSAALHSSWPCGWRVTSQHATWRSNAR